MLINCIEGILLECLPHSLILGEVARLDDRGNPIVSTANNHIHLQATVMRPAAMIGTEDRVLNPWAHFAKNYGFLPLIGEGTTKYDSQ